MFFAVILCGCASPPKLEFPYYGNFCGPGYPRVDEESLKKIEPADVVDAACQKHDLCYARRGQQDGTQKASYTEMCDELLERELDHRSLSPACANLALDIKNYFRSVHPNAGVLRSAYKMTLGPPLFVAQGPGTRPLKGSCQYSKKYEQAWGGKPWVETSRYLPWVAMYVGEERRGQNLLRRKEMLTCREKYKLGIHYELGIGVLQNYQQARELYLESYNCGIPAVAELLGEIYFEGKGVERDERTALAWFERCNSAPGHLAGASHCKIMMDLIEYKMANP
ncbi:MAG: hypothetical protein ACREBC_22145 [Pyrinomonadaceae bacterium]